MFINKKTVLIVIISYSSTHTVQNVENIQHKMPQGNSAYMAQPTPRKANCFKRTTEELYQIGNACMEENKKHSTHKSLVSQYIRNAHQNKKIYRQRTWVMAEPYGRNESKYTRSRSTLYTMGTRYLRELHNKNKAK